MESVLNQSGAQETVNGKMFVCFKADSIDPKLKEVCRDMRAVRGNSKCTPVIPLPSHKNYCRQQDCLLMIYNGFLFNALCISGI